MYSFDESFLEGVGLSNLPQNQKDIFLQYAQDQFEIRIGEKMSQALNEEQLTEFENIIDNDKATVDRILGELGDYHQDPVYQQLMVNTGAGDGSIELINAYVTAKWLDKNCPTYGNMINESLEELRAEIISQKDAILAAA